MKNEKYPFPIWLSIVMIVHAIISFIFVVLNVFDISNRKVLGLILSPYLILFFFLTYILFVETIKWLSENTDALYWQIVVLLIYVITGATFIFDFIR